MEKVLVSHFFTLTFKKQKDSPKSCVNKMLRNLAKFTKSHIVGDYFMDVQEVREEFTTKKVYHIHGWLGDVEGRFLLNNEISRLMEFSWMDNQGKAVVRLYDYSKSDENLKYLFEHEHHTSFFFSPRKANCKARRCPVCRKSKELKPHILFSQNCKNVQNRKKFGLDIWKEGHQDEDQNKTSSWKDSNYPQRYRAMLN
jgi:hypothetical protein